MLGSTLLNTFAQCTSFAWLGKLLVLVPNARYVNGKIKLVALTDMQAMAHDRRPCPWSDAQG